MTDESGSRSGPNQSDDRTDPDRSGTVAVVFGDSIGLTVFLGALVLFGLTWRTEVFFNDIKLFVRMVGRLANGHLALGTVSGVDWLAPGMHVANGRVYGRNVGQVAFAVPFVWLVEAVDAVADVRAVVVVGWSALVAVVAARVGTAAGYRRRGLAVGVVLAAGSLALNAAYYRPYVGDAAILGLQLSTMVAGAYTGVLVYRLLARRHGTTVGALAGAVTVLGTPVGFWATVGKRHALVAALVVLAAYALARSRDERGGEADGDCPLVPRPAGFRALAYGCAGLVAWIHAPNGFTVLIALAAVDLPTGRRNPRTLAVVGAGFALSLLPFLATNAAMSGNPLLPPRFLPRFPQSVDPATLHEAIPKSLGEESAGGAADPTAGGTGRATADARAIRTGGGRSVASLVERGLRMYVSGIVTAVTDPGRVVTVLFRHGRRGYSSGVFFESGTNLAVLEAAPVAAALVAAPVGRRLRAVAAGSPGGFDVDPVDLFAVCVSVAFASLYLNRLPVPIQLTTRYLHPLYPLLVYGVFRQPRVRRVLTTHLRPAALSYETTVLLGTPLVAGALILRTASKGDVVQAFALAGLAVAGVLAAALLAGSRDERADPVAAVAFGTAVGVTTVYLLVTAFFVMHFGASMLPAVESISGDIRFEMIA
ncbi:MAG: hypothetical protein ABEJ40_06765 [Haloarculaceae archaeon]